MNREFWIWRCLSAGLAARLTTHDPISQRLALRKPARLSAPFKNHSVSNTFAIFANGYG
ncbi:hypothetical protein [Paraburkholderia sp. MM5384-R2]|uniref:hypothetical protein n=1 Tax=Paraburkholderia sp. MM5384-R2 TaxID=2723097 RepID=UPI00161A9FB2|nr:hypothetical protein [Paraburkholderia sp. MM5384-R2]MBB5497990.1 hypothetical protein [Paraburkholderia sp. MM5384-R2]